jgi:hypothetical protein
VELLNFKNGLTNLKNLLNFRLSSWGPIKVGAQGNLLPPAPPPPLGGALTRIYEYAPPPPHRSSTAPTSFPGLSYEDEGRDEKALVWAGHMTTQKMAVFDSYSSRSGEIFFNEIYKSSKQINKQKTSQSILFMCSEVWHESAEISEDPIYVF